MEEPPLPKNIFNEIIFANTLKSIEKVCNSSNNNITIKYLMLLAYCGLFYYFKLYRLVRITIGFAPVGIHAPPIVCDYQEMITNNKKNLEGLLLNGR